MAKEHAASRSRVGSGALWGAAATVIMLGVVDVIVTFASKRPWTASAELFITALWCAAGLIAVYQTHVAHENELIAERLRARATSLEASVVHAKLDALRMQLNPHFLFNALNAVTGLVVRGRAADAQEMLGRLGGLLRKTLTGDQAPFLSVQEEVALLNDFLFIEKIRFGDRLTVAVTVDDAALDGEIPSMLLQPLVENAVRHGIEPTLAPGTVLVDVSRQNGHLLVRIEDSGRGFPLVGGRLSREGIGLTNTRTRLRELFGDRASLSLSNRVEGGARLEVCFPWRPSS
jgi:two-component system, LytTR family, sensor kinase